MIKIGVSANFFYPDRNRKLFVTKSLSYVENDMFKFVSRPGILPVLIPCLEDSILLPILGELDGFVFTGGSDIAPESYGEEPILDGKWKGDIFRDKYELRLMDYAFKNNKPILGICRGFQLMNVYFGGTLYQDAETQMEKVLKHRDSDLYDKIKHEIKFLPGNFLTEHFKGATSSQVNTVHHQSIKDLGENLEVLAISPEDNIIEAIGYTKAPDGKIFGVQCHPEFTDSLKGEILDMRSIYDIFLSHINK